jgi:hypothetical protein
VSSLPAILLFRILLHTVGSTAMKRNSETGAAEIKEDFYGISLSETDCN